MVGGDCYARCVVWMPAFAGMTFLKSWKDNFFICRSGGGWSLDLVSLFLFVLSGVWLGGFCYSPSEVWMPAGVYPSEGWDWHDIFI
jgi:hypothetical protein